MLFLEEYFYFGYIVQIQRKTRFIQRSDHVIWNLIATQHYKYVFFVAIFPPINYEKQFEMPISGSYNSM